MTEKQYKAFISYRHIEPDMQVAERLQKMIETYKPPKELGLTFENRRVFRDVSELPTSGNLGDDIRTALEHSEFLIAICSPEYPRSKWCMEELRYFLELHGGHNDRILTLLVDGKPEQSFPEELCYSIKETLNEAGETVTVHTKIEPLAANIVMPTKKESLAKLKTEFLRLAAPMLGCGFDDLYRREKKRAAQRRHRRLGLAFAVLGVIAAISITSAVTIMGKNREIETKNQTLSIENARHLATESEAQYEKKELISSIHSALEALPQDGEDKPVVPEAEYALARALGAFDYQQMSPVHQLEHKATVEDITFAGEGQTIVSQDATGIYVWDAQTGRLLHKYTGQDEEFRSDSAVSEDSLSLWYEPILSIRESLTGSNGNGKFRLSLHAAFGILRVDRMKSTEPEISLQKHPVYLYNSDKIVWRLDESTGDILWKAGISDQAYGYTDIFFLSDGIVRIYHERVEPPAGYIIWNGEGERTFAEWVDPETGKVTETVDVTPLVGKSKLWPLNLEIQTFSDKEIRCSYYDSFFVCPIKEGVVIPSKETEILSQDVSFSDMEKYADWYVLDQALVRTCPTNSQATLMGLFQPYEIVRFDDKGTTELWKTTVKDLIYSPDAMVYFSAEDSGNYTDLLAIIGDEKIAVIDARTGEVIHEYLFDYEIVTFYYSQNGILYVITGNGQEIALILSGIEKGQNFYFADLTGEFAMPVAAGAYYDHHYVTPIKMIMLHIFKRL
ncbi:MAG: TIR domain-containing protein [Clostridia bacterium]|nr:TIR domain-containing protein [Clostridia bacterium]